MVGDSGWLIGDIIPTLVEVAKGFFLFLDLFVEHFNSRIRAETSQEIIELTNPFHTELYRFNKALSSFWPFPYVDRTGINFQK